MQADISQTPTPQSAPQQTATAQVFYLDPTAYDRTLAILVQYTGFVWSELQKPEPITYEKIGVMLGTYLQSCMVKGMAPEEQPMAGGKCTYTYIKGDKNGQLCGKSAKFRGIDGQPKCSAHKNSAGKKSSNEASGPAPSGAAGQVFSYSASQAKGKTAPQSLVSIQASIQRQTEPAQLTLAQAPHPDNRVYNPQTNIVFEQRQDGEQLNWVAVGVLEGPVTAKLKQEDLAVCYGNSWKWDTNCVDDETARSMAHPLVISPENPLVPNPEAVSAISTKIQSVLQNNV